jgi:hypothetical protein
MPDIVVVLPAYAEFPTSFGDVARRPAQFQDVQLVGDDILLRVMVFLLARMFVVNYLNQRAMALFTTPELDLSIHFLVWAH